MFYLVHIIGYLCQSLLHLLQVLPLFLKLEIELHAISNQKKWEFTHFFYTHTHTNAVILYEWAPLNIHMQYVFLCSAGCQAVTIWMLKNLLVLERRMVQPQGAGILADMTACKNLDLNCNKVRPSISTLLWIHLRGFWTLNQSLITDFIPFSLYVLSFQSGQWY